MTAPHETPTIHLRIPGNWSHPGELLERLPEGYRLRSEAFYFPDGSHIDFVPLEPDDQFPHIFESSCRRPAHPDELNCVRSYTVNVALSGPGGSLESAYRMMEAGAAIVHAGGAGVFIDNCALAHGGDDWMELTDDATSDAIGFAFVSVIRGQNEVYTMGMHALGYADLLMHADDVEKGDDVIIETIRYICRGEKPIDVGHILADEQGPRYQVISKIAGKYERSSPLHNPYGRMKIVNIRGIAEGN